jgi:hypothetical protein
VKKGMKNMLELYQELSKKLNRINFELLWPGFKRYEFAIYTSEKVQFANGEIPWDERFIGNTAIHYDGSYIAIWNVEHGFMKNDSGDIDILAANIVHEMFHAYQYENGENRWPKDLITIKYPNDIENFSLKFEENKILADAFEQQDLEKKRTLLNYFCGIRHKRESIIGTMFECEYLTETAEGMAEYIGMLALKMLSQTKYTNKVMAYLKMLREHTAIQVNIRKISYYCGPIILLVAKDVGINIIHSISNEAETIFRIISHSLSPRLPDNLHYEPNIKVIAEETKNLKRKEIEQFLEQKRIEQTGNFFISGYDPMNMFSIDGYIFCKTFVKLTNRITNVSTTLTGKTLLEVCFDSDNQIRCYYR